MKLVNQSLLLSKEELLSMIGNDNPEKNDWSKENLLSMINSFRIFSDKQYKWILSKVKYIINHNDKYKNYRKKIKDFEIDN